MSDLQIVLIMAVATLFLAGLLLLCERVRG